MLEVTCRYQQGSASAGWGVFSREASRCGRERTLGRVSFSAGEKITVPPAPDGSSLVFARFDFSVPLLQRLIALAFRPPDHLTIAADGRSFRVARPDVAGPLLVRATPNLGWDSGFGGDVAYSSLEPSLEGTVTFSTIRSPARQTSRKPRAGESVVLSTSYLRYPEDSPVCSSRTPWSHLRREGVEAEVA